MNTPTDTHSYVELRNINKHLEITGHPMMSASPLRKESSSDFWVQVEAAKSTILRILAGLETADSGDIYIDGKKCKLAFPPARGRLASYSRITRCSDTRQFMTISHLE